MKSYAWFTTDEGADVVGSLRHCLASFALAKTDPHAWKWVLLSLHSALQGACVSHLTTTAQPIGSLTKESTKAWLEFFERQRHDSEFRPPATKILSLPELLKRVRKQRSAGDGSDHPLIQITDAELDWLRHFHDTLRNQFTHFEPMGWTIEVSGIPKLAALIARIISDISAAHWAFRHLEEADKDSLLQSLAAMRST